MRTFLIVVLLGLSAATQAAPVTIDFTDPSIPPYGSSFVTEGYLFSFSPDQTPSVPYVINFWPGLGYCPSCVLNIESATSNTFDVSSFDGQFFADGFFEVTGYLEGGGTVSATLASIPSVTQTYNLNWTGLTRLSIGNTSGSSTNINSITVSSVPVPAAVWLFGSGLGLLGWLRRRQPA